MFDFYFLFTSSHVVCWLYVEGRGWRQGPRAFVDREGLEVLSNEFTTFGGFLHFPNESWRLRSAIPYWTVDTKIVNSYLPADVVATVSPIPPLIYVVHRWVKFISCKRRSCNQMD